MSDNKNLVESHYMDIVNLISEGSKSGARLSAINRERDLLTSKYQILNRKLEEFKRMLEVEREVIDSEIRDFDAKNKAEVDSLIKFCSEYPLTIRSITTKIQDINSREVVLTT